uniref:uncharacterized protein LOC101314891 isoform X3 n=1 Tax=Fragaria vesca subsp. vesca TaxID=101020 RepID=UPI0005C9B1F0|nr:PREDICTED: uncharacterized protein LOC101314891 isoform X3 [Fragaria vesca subsp. vesca]
MVASDFTALLPRLKREECKRTKHDSHFSNWKVLVGPSDWEDYWLGKEGAERYRVYNLPRDESPGVYELGVAVSRSGLGRGVEADRIVPVYLGQADSVRTRLQQYGRTGAHLGKCCSSERIRKGPGLFEEMLGRGYPIVYRWAPMRTKNEALRTERKLLDTFDYAWNRNSNASRRRDDVLQKLKKISSKSTRFTATVPRHLPFRQKQVSIRINSSNLISTEKKFSDYADKESRNLIPQVIKFGRSQPRLVLDGSGITQENTIVCGVAIGDGPICRKAPVQGRKRCAAHKGIKNTGSTTDSNREWVSFESGITWENTEICGVAAGDGSTCRRPPVQGRKRCAEHKGMRNTESTTASTRELVTYNSGVTLENTEICGVAAGDGSICRVPPVPGRVRCAMHKGMRNTGLTTASNSELVTYKSGNTLENTEICGLAAGDGSTCGMPPVPGRVRCAMHKGMRNTESSTASNIEFFPYISGNTRENTEICGMTAGNGSICRRPPVPGRVRCAMHKGMRNTESSTASNIEFFSYISGNTRENTEICGVTAGNGSICRRPPVPGRVRCAMHKGMRITESTTASNREFVSYSSGNTWDNTDICGVTAGNGSICRRPPVPGRVRCAMHKGMRR